MVKATMKAVYDLTQGLTGKVVFRGTHESTLCEAQGGQLFKNGYNYFSHLSNLSEQRERIQNDGLLLSKGLSVVHNVNSGIYHRLDATFSPLIAYQRSASQLALSTENKAHELAQTFGKRLEGYPFKTGDRVEADLISSQMDRIHETHKDGRFQKHLLPDPSDERTVTYFQQVRKLPINQLQAQTRFLPVLNHLHLQTLRHNNVADPTSKEELRLFIQPLKFIVDFAKGEPYATGIPSDQVESALVDAMDGRKLS